jgi:hypothetical protein
MQLNFGHNLVLVLIWENVKLHLQFIQKDVIFVFYLGEGKKDVCKRPKDNNSHIK